jgi:hypothetical protein
MQFYIIYQHGVGGDGFANLLEHANNMHRADGLRDPNRWRIMKKIGNKTRFYGALWTTIPPHPFRGHPMDKDSRLAESYLELIEKKKNTVISTHYHYFDSIKYFPFRELIERDQVKIHLYSTDFERVILDDRIKNGRGLDKEQIVKAKNAIDEIHTKHVNETILVQEIERNLTKFASYYDMHIDIEQVWNSWEYLDEKLKILGIDLDKSYYDEYMRIVRQEIKLVSLFDALYNKKSPNIPA